VVGSILELCATIRHGAKRNFRAGAEYPDRRAGPELAQKAYAGKNDWTCSSV